MPTSASLKKHLWADWLKVHITIHQTWKQVQRFGIAYKFNVWQTAIYCSADMVAAWKTHHIRKNIRKCITDISVKYMLIRIHFKQASLYWTYCTSLLSCVWVTPVHKDCVCIFRCAAPAPYYCAGCAGVPEVSPHTCPELSHTLHLQFLV